MKLKDYLDGMRQATSPEELEKAIQAPFQHPYIGPTWSRISNVRIAEGLRICDAHPNGRFVPRFGPRRVLALCDETYRVGRGGNTTGIRYAWHDAETWALSIFLENGFAKSAAHAIWGNAFKYPHRALQSVQDALGGKFKDPPLDRLIYTGRCSTGNPVRVDRAYEAKHRAHRDCKCGGWLWDWGCGESGYDLFISWRCDRCSRTYTQYLTSSRLMEIRAEPAASQAA